MKEKYFVSQLVENTPLLLTCEHASRAVPEIYGQYLGLSHQDFENAKDVDDPGALDLMRNLQERCTCSYLYAMISRAVIDVNRQLVDQPRDTFHASALKQQLLTERDGKEIMIDVPANSSGSEEEKRRFEEIAVPYHGEACRIVNALRVEHEHVVIMQVHSFFRKYNGTVRETDIGILFRKRHMYHATTLQEILQEKLPCLCIDLNKPYDLSEMNALPVAMDQFETEDDITILIVEVANDLLQEDDPMYDKIIDALHAATKHLID